MWASYRRLFFGCLEKGQSRLLSRAALLAARKQEKMIMTMMEL